MRRAVVILPFLLPTACHPCTWPDRVEWEAPRLNAAAFRQGTEDQHPGQARALPLLPPGVPDEHVLEDGTGLVVEIQAQGQYRTYHYDDPEYQTWPEARQVEQIIDVVRHRILCLQKRPGSERRE